MMHVLLESAGRPRRRDTRWTAMSVAVHAGLIGTTLALASQATEPEGVTREPVQHLVYVVRSAMSHATPSALRGSPGIASIPAPPDVKLPGSITIPAVPTFDVTTASSQALANGLRALGPGLDTGASIGHGNPGGIHSAGAVDRVVAGLPQNPRPEYPHSLRAAAVEGEVLITFVVDTTGRVEQGSLRVLQATHEQFAESVRRWLPKTRYRPAEIGGRRVRQYVQQQVGFTLTNER